MKEEYISDALNLLDDAFIEETDILRNSYRIPQKKFMVQKVSYVVRKHWKWAAACLLLIVFIVSSIFIQNIPDKDKITSTQELPMLSITENTSEGMGFEGYMAYDISEIASNNPWDEGLQISVLPVYRNTLSYDGHYIVSGANFEKMREFLIDIADRLGLDTSSLSITDNAPGEEERRIITEKMDGDVPEGYFNPTKLITKTDGIEITVSQSMVAVVCFEPGIPLPDGYHFTSNASYKESVAVAKYLRDKYKDFIHMENPQINICGGDYSVYDTGVQQEYNIAFYDAGKSDVDKIVNYNFNQVEFQCDYSDSGKLYSVSICQPDLSQKMGDYPIITAEKAKEFLLEGNYITTVPYKFPGGKFISKTELVYRTGEREEYFMPYYRFYVELPDGKRAGLNNYGVYYVPAVEKEYLTNMPVWDGSFN